MWQSSLSSASQTFLLWGLWWLNQPRAKFLLKSWSNWLLIYFLILILGIPSNCHAEIDLELSNFNQKISLYSKTFEKWLKSIKNDKVHQLFNWFTLFWLISTFLIGSAIFDLLIDILSIVLYLIINIWIKNVRIR